MRFFVFDRGGEVMPDHTRYRASTASIGQPPGLRALPVDPRFLGRPRLLTRAAPLPMGGTSRRSTLFLLIFTLSLGRYKRPHKVWLQHHPTA